MKKSLLLTAKADFMFFQRVPLEKKQPPSKISAVLFLLLWSTFLSAQTITYTCPTGFEPPVRFDYNGTNTSDGIEQNFVIPANVTEVTIIALGGQGGHVENFGGTFDQLGGAGGLLGGTFSVVPGDNLRIFVAAQGGRTLNDGSGRLHGAGGGGGSYVLKNNLTIADLLVVAGGGSGSTLNNNGTNSQAFVTTGGGGGGTTGAANMGSAGAGGGLLTDGATNPDGIAEGEGGKSITNGGTGGVDRRRGGFGGGGAGGESEAAINGSGGGGGGFIGGNGGSNGLPGQGGFAYVTSRDYTYS